MISQLKRALCLGIAILSVSPWIAMAADIRVENGVNVYRGGTHQSAIPFDTWRSPASVNVFRGGELGSLSPRLASGVTIYSGGIPTYTNYVRIRTNQRGRLVCWHGQTAMQDHQGARVCR